MCYTNTITINTIIMKDIIGYEGLYAVTESGKIWGYPKPHRYSTIGKNTKGRFLKPWLIGHGYETVSLYKEHKDKKFLVHRLIGSAYIPNPQNLREINHKNGNRLDNRVTNLEWVSSKENKAHAWKNGMYTHSGENHYLAKLNPKKVRQIRQLHQKGMNGMKIAKLMKISFGTAYGVLRGRSWSHIN